MKEADIVDRAIDMERLSRDFYRDLASGSVQKYAAGALERLAEEEQRHMDILEDYRRSRAGAGAPRLPAADASAETWRRFTAAIDDLKKAIEPHTDEMTVVQRGIELEERGIAVYSEARDTMPDTPGKQVFDFLAVQEVLHRDYLQALLDKLAVLYEEPPETRPKL